MQDNQMSQQQERMQREQQQVRDRLSTIKNKILVLSGKGGVGKSTVAVNTAISLADKDKKVGLLDIDIHGPSIPKVLNLQPGKVAADGETMIPVQVSENLKVMSIGLLVPDSDAAVIWRGPRKYHAIKQFLKDVRWGELDYLIIDSPPGTGDEIISIVQLLENPDGAIIVTTPQQLALSDVRKGVDFCRSLKVKVLGVIENMSGFVCPKCGEKTDIFKSGGAERMATELNIPFMGAIPIDPQIVEACDSGTPYISKFEKSRTSDKFKEIINKFFSESNTSENQESKIMKIAVPVFQGKLSLHFGHCDEFAIASINKENNEISDIQTAGAPFHEPGALPKWLNEQGVDLVIAGGMGQRAQLLLKESGVDVLVGAESDEPKNVIQAYLEGKLETGENICDH
jgi:Mrp family chromosome partitioning ATPase/predicted Fe-Mo cluster-binding NifX family protein